MDYDIHPPTIYFPLIVSEALMIEPTETEPKERLDGFVDAMRRIAKEAAEVAQKLLKEAPHGRPCVASTRCEPRSSRCSATSSTTPGAGGGQ